MCWLCEYPLFWYSPYTAHRKLIEDYQKRKRPAAPGTPSPASSLFPGTARGQAAPQNAVRGANRRLPENPAIIAPEHGRQPENQALPPVPPPPPAPQPPAHVPEREEEPAPPNREDVFYDEEEEEDLPEPVQQDEATKNKRLEILGYLMPLIFESQGLGIDVAQVNKYVSWTIAAHNIQELNEPHALQFKKQLEDAIAAKKAQG